jgi:hypothetical protein
MTDEPLRDALRAVDRAKRCLRLLAQSRLESDISQSVGGIGTELLIIDSAIRQALGAALIDAVADSPGKVRADAPATSRAAARAIRIASGNQRGRILLALHNHHGLTDHDLPGVTDMKPDSVRPRRGELVDTGLVLGSDAVRHINGQDWRVWTCTPLGHQVAIELTRQGINGAVEINPSDCVQPVPAEDVAADPADGDPVLF